MRQDVNNGVNNAQARKRHFDSRKAIERTMFGGLDGFTFYSVFYLHLNLLEAEVEVIGLASY